MLRSPSPSAPSRRVSTRTSSTTAASAPINDNIYETLLTRDAEGELGPGLATELPTQVDDTTWEFKLRDGVTFHDGTPFNADAVVASVDRIIRLVAEEKTDNNGFY